MMKNTEYSLYILEQNNIPNGNSVFKYFFCPISILARHFQFLQFFMDVRALLSRSHFYTEKQFSLFYLQGEKIGQENVF